jgi:transposase
VGDPRDEKIAELERIIAAQRETIERLMARVTALEARLAQNSSNSGKPPSSDPPAERDERQKPKPSGKQRGGQPGHKGHRRELLPPEAVTATEDHFPKMCDACGEGLPREPCGEPFRHQVVEVPVVRPEVTEHRQHAVRCVCGCVTRAKLPEGLPPGMCGPRLTALIALFTGAYHLSRRSTMTLLGDLLGVRIALGTLSESEERVSDALAIPVEQALEHACRAPVKHVDATGWRQAGKARSLWTIATAVVTVFAITLDGTRAHLREVLTTLRGILVSDRAPQFTFWAMQRRQICWAHLLRKFMALSEDKTPEIAKLGEHLLLFGHVLFHQWHRVRDGTLSLAAFRRESMALRMCVESLLQQGVDLCLPGVTGSCADILAHRQALWTFIDRTGVEPTNNHGERELRAFVLWRKKSFGSQSDRGCRFAERVMTTVHTLRKQQRHVLSFLTEAVDAAFRHQASPSLLPSPP